MKIQSSFEFPVSLIKQYLYCPRIPYFVLVLGFKERTTELMIDGKKKHDRVLKRMRSKGWNVNTFLKSKKYNIYGYVDAFRKEENGYVVMELKDTNYKKRILKMHLYQVAAYGLLVEENFGRVYKIIVRYNDKEIFRPFTRGIKNYVVSIINKIHRIHDIGLVSIRIDKRKCYNCGFRNRCKEV